MSTTRQVDQAIARFDEVMGRIDRGSAERVRSNDCPNTRTFAGASARTSSGARSQSAAALSSAFFSSGITYCGASDSASFSPA